MSKIYLKGYGLSWIPSAVKEEEIKLCKEIQAILKNAGKVMVCPLMTPCFVSVLRSERDLETPYTNHTNVNRDLSLSITFLKLIIDEESTISHGLTVLALTGFSAL